MTESPSSGCFEFDGLRILVESDDPADLTWLEEFLCPQFELFASGRGDCCVRLCRDGKRFAQLAASRGGRGADEQVVDCFALDQQVIALPRWQAPGAGPCIFDEKFRTFYVVEPDSSRVDIIGAPDGRGPRIPAMRVIREFGMNRGLARGGLFVHGSSFVAGDTGVLIAGPSWAGKTTLLIHFLTRAKTAYLSNDRVLVSMGDDGTTLRGMPAIVTLRSTTLDHFPRLGRSLVESSYSHKATLAESGRRTEPIRAWGDGRYGLTPAQFCALLGAPSERSARAAAVLMPQQTHRPGGIALTRLTPDVAATRLHDAIFGIGCWAHEANIFALPGDRSRASVPELKRRCRELAGRVPFFLCELGEQAYEDLDSATSVLDRLSDAEFLRP